MINGDAFLYGARVLPIMNSFAVHSADLYISEMHPWRPCRYPQWHAISVSTFSDPKVLKARLDLS